MKKTIRIDSFLINNPRALADQSRRNTEFELFERSSQPYSGAAAAAPFKPSMQGRVPSEKGYVFPSKQDYILMTRTVRMSARDKARAERIERIAGYRLARVSIIDIAEKEGVSRQRIDQIIKAHLPPELGTKRVRHALIEGTCIQCGKTTWAHYRARKYCDRDCLRAWYEARNTPEYIRAKMDRLNGERRAKYRSDPKMRAYYSEASKKWAEKNPEKHKEMSRRAGKRYQERLKLDPERMKAERARAEAHRAKRIAEDPDYALRYKKKQHEGWAKWREERVKERIAMIKKQFPTMSEEHIRKAIGNSNLKKFNYGN